MYRYTHSSRGLRGAGSGGGGGGSPGMEVMGRQACVERRACRCHKYEYVIVLISSAQFFLTGRKDILVCTKRCAQSCCPKQCWRFAEGNGIKDFVVVRGRKFSYLYSYQFAFTC